MARQGPIASAAANGCYEAERAAALSGVPKSTVYHWARHEVIVPSVSPVREKLWSYSDLMALRIVAWLRHLKPAQDGQPLPASPMPKVRKALALLDNLQLDIWSEAAPARSPLLVGGNGQIFVRLEGTVLDLNGQPSLLPEQVLNLTGPFDADKFAGPDLIRPRPHLRIVPSKLAGEPHIERSRVTTQAVAALRARGYEPEAIAEMYSLDVISVNEGIELEQSLAEAV